MDKKRVEYSIDPATGYLISILFILVPLLLIIFNAYLICDLIGDGGWLVIFFINLFASIFLFLYLKKNEDPQIWWAVKLLINISWAISFIALILFIGRPFSLCGGHDMNNGCTELKIRLVGANSIENSVIINRMAGGTEFSVGDFEILVNGKEAKILSVSEGNNSLGELQTKTYTVDYDINTGDTVEVAPIVLDGKKIRTCDVIGQTRAF